MASRIDEHEYAANNWNNDPDRTRCHCVRFRDQRRQQPAVLRLHVMHDDDVARCIRDSGQADDFMEMCYVDNTPMLAISNHGVAKNGPQSRAWRIPGKGWGLGPDHLCASW